MSPNFLFNALFLACGLTFLGAIYIMGTLDERKAKHNKLKADFELAKAELKDIKGNVVVPSALESRVSAVTKADSEYKSLSEHPLYSKETFDSLHKFKGNRVKSLRK